MARDSRKNKKRQKRQYEPRVTEGSLELRSSSSLFLLQITPFGLISGLSFGNAA
jgi:hypothetical protein